MLVRVLDRNDNRPRFDQDSYEVMLAESFAVGDSFLTITATDADEDKRLLYTMHAVADDASAGKFKIDTETGQSSISSPIFRLCSSFCLL